MPSVTTCRACGLRINGHPRQLADEQPLLGSDGFYRHVGCTTDQIALRRRDEERERLEIKLRLAMPHRSTTDQADAAHLPLFVAANEPTFL